jgi:AraC-like DNA-binding protein
MPGDAPPTSKSNGASPQTRKAGCYRIRPESCGAAVSVAWLPGPSAHVSAGRGGLAILLRLTGAKLTLCCRTPAGLREVHPLEEGQLALLGAGARKVAVHGEAGCLLVQVSAQFRREIGAPAPVGIAVRTLAVLAQGDPALWLHASELRRAATAKRRATYVTALATVFAAHTLAAHARCPTGTLPRRGLTPMQLRTVTDFIASHLRENLSAGLLAKQVHLSAFHFARRFKAAAGVTPHVHVIEERLRRAEAMLRTGDHRVAEVAHEVGLCDQSHLDRLFRRHRGFPPKFLLPPPRAQE